MSHHLFWVPLNWPWLTFLAVLVLALVLAHFLSRSLYGTGGRLYHSYRRVSVFGVLAVTIVLYLGITWNMWWWVHYVFWWTWVIGLVCGLASRVSGLFRLPAYLGTWIAAFIVVVLFLVQVIWLPLWGLITESPDHVAHDIEKSAPTATPSASPSPSPTATPKPSVTPSPKATATPAKPTDCPNPVVGWPMSLARPVNGKWFTVTEFPAAHGEPAAFRTFKCGWYKQATQRARLLAQLNRYVLPDDVGAAELIDHGHASDLAVRVGHRLSLRLKVPPSVQYSMDSTSIKVVLPEGMAFWVDKSTGRLSLTKP